MILHNINETCCFKMISLEVIGTKKMNGVCLHYGCTKCCMNTEMQLSSSDVTRIRDLGFSEDFFIFNRNGSRQLKNVNGRCVFHNGKGCTIYNYRPEGCRLYPAVFDENCGKVVLHSYCPHRGKFQLTPATSREVFKLIRKLDLEEASSPQEHA